MSSRREEQYSMTLAIERGAARIHVTDSGSPTRIRVPRGEYRLPPHRMRLRSHTRAHENDLSQAEDDALHPRHSSATPRRSSGNSSEATTEISHSHNAPRHTPTSSPFVYHEGTPKSQEGPFLTFTPSPTRDESRIWEFDAEAQQDFVIWEDESDEDDLFQLTPIPYSDLDEDKENTYATVSDYDSPEDEDPQDNHLDWRLRLGPRDAFGLPLATTFGNAIPDAPARGILDPHAVPTVADTNVRPAVRAVFRDDEESDQEWDESLTRAQIREIQELTDIFARGVENRRLYDRHVPMRDFNAQGQANIFLEVRRITEFQRHRDRRPSGGGEDDEE